jgi:hypothetical protein
LGSGVTVTSNVFRVKVATRFDVFGDCEGVLCSFTDKYFKNNPAVEVVAFCRVASTVIFRSDTYLPPPEAIPLLQG